MLMSQELDILAT